MCIRDRYEDLVKSIRKYHPSDDLGMVEKAYQIARDAHKDQKRKSGEPYIIHPLCVAIILADLELDKESIIAGIPVSYTHLICKLIVEKMNGRILVDSQLGIGTTFIIELPCRSMLVE